MPWSVSNGQMVNTECPCWAPTACAASRGLTSHARRRFIQSLGPAHGESRALMEMLGCHLPSQPQRASQSVSLGCDGPASAAQSHTSRPHSALHRAQVGEPGLPRTAQTRKRAANHRQGLQQAAVAARQRALKSKAAWARHCQTAPLQHQLRARGSAAGSQACKLQAVRLVTACC